MRESRSKTLLKNTGIFAVSNLSSKLLVFLMLPLYTNVLTTTEYGQVDLVVSVVSLMLPFATLGMHEAALRFVMDKDYDQKFVFTTSVTLLAIGLIALGMLYPLFAISHLVGNLVAFVYIISIPNYYYTLLSAFARGVDKVFHTGVAGVLASLVLVISNVMGLLVFRAGMVGYLLSYALSYMVAGMYLLIVAGLYRYFSINCLTKSNIQLVWTMLKYSIPLIPNRIAWWFNNTANRYVINLIMGPSSVGIYSAAIKIPTILDSIQSIFGQAWLLSAVQEIDSDDCKEYYRKNFHLFCCLLIVGCSALIACKDLIASVLLGAEFRSAAGYSSMLLISSVLGGMVSFSSAIFNAHKQNTPLLISAILGAFISVSGCLLLTPIIGLYGAVIANNISYALIWILLASSMRKRFCLVLSSKTINLGIILVVAQSIGAIVATGILLICLQLWCVVLVLFVWRKYIVAVLNCLWFTAYKRTDH